MDFKHVLAFITKFLMILSIAFATLTVFFGVSFWNILGISLFISAVGYLLGDLYALKKFGNIITSILEAGFVFIVAYLFANTNVDTPIMHLYAAFSIAVISVISEFVFHMFIELTSSEHHSSTEPREPQYLVEMGEELMPIRQKAEEEVEKED